MPFYALIGTHTGEILDVVESLDGPVPAGAIAVELPARDDDVRAWLARNRKHKAGNGGNEVFLDPEEDAASRSGGHKQEVGDAEQFFARLSLELLRAEATGLPLGLLLFDLHAADRSMARDFVLETLTAAKQELLACDFIAHVRDHLVVVLMPDMDAHELRIVPERGEMTPLTFPRDREVIESLRRRRHPLLRQSRRR